MKPRISATRRADGTYDFTVDLLAPNLCYSLGLVSLGPPKNVKIVPEVLAVTVTINYSEAEICALSMRPLHYELDGVKVTADKQAVTVFVVIHGQKSGTDILSESASLPLPILAVGLVD